MEIILKNNKTTNSMSQEFTPTYTFSEDRLNELKQLFPEAFEDGVFNVDTLKTLIGEFATDNTEKEHFGLNWVGKQDARKIATKPPTGTLKPCPGEGVNEDITENIFIEGENLEVLKILRKSYMGEIKMIYIDPPYNTGNDFIYNDIFADSTEDYLRKSGEKTDEGLLVSNPKSSGKYHANWLSFMYPRLRLAKDLLRKDGVIFISIGPDEIANLKLASDEIFGEENLAGICVRKAKSGGNKGKYFSPNVEYILIYTKNTSSANGFRAEMDEGLIKKVYTKIEKFGEKKGERYRAMGLYQSSLDARANQRYYVEAPDGTLVIPPGSVFPILKTEGEKIKPEANDDGVWRWTFNRYKFEKEKGNIEFNKTKNKVLVDSEGNPSDWNVNTKIWLKERQDEGQLPNDLIIKYENRHSAKELKLLDIPFDFAKPSGLIKYLMEITGIDNNDIVFDFFAGSGTTAHAVIDYNKENTKESKFILTQLPEKITNKEAIKKGYKIISDITKSRIKKVMNIIGVSNGFKVYKQDKSTIYKWQDFNTEDNGGTIDLFSKLEQDLKNPIQKGVQTQDFITEVILQEGFPLTAKQEEVVSGIFKITHEWIPYTLYATMLYSFKDTDLSKISLNSSDHFVCLDKAFEGNDSLKQMLDNQCKLYTI